MHGGASRAHPRSRGENWGGDACGVVAAGSSPLTRGKRSSLTDRQTPRPAHPRSRGENTSGRRSPSRAKGSSPLTRGKLLQPCYSLVTGGLIPAHAGKTPAGRGGGAGARAHPRSRGENGGVHRLWRGEEGSSPLTRGKHADVPVDFILGGLIPAHAGKTAGHGQAPCAAGAHPRSRGENANRAIVIRPAEGSSPLTRGKRSELLPRVGGGGLIPAHAGKTTCLRQRRKGRRAHPRSRGENAIPAKTMTPTSGSSPLTRGKPRSDNSYPVPCGLIPAHAGKTREVFANQSRSTAHPRSRGENPYGCTGSDTHSGSSPLTRGKHELGARGLSSFGLIPAHAGKTSTATARPTRTGAHPRSRGENLRLYGLGAMNEGSSPLTRGKRCGASA